MRKENGKLIVIKKEFPTYFGFTRNDIVALCSENNIYSNEECMKRKIRRFLMDLEISLFKTFWYFDRAGFWFLYHGDEVCWIYPWRRTNKDEKWISLFFSGSGQFGDAVYKTLKDIDDEYDAFCEAQ